MNVKAIDHIVLTVKDIDATCAFYARVLGMSVITFVAIEEPYPLGHRKSICISPDVSLSRKPRNLLQDPLICVLLPQWTFRM
jgi:catechol-2,3-dioxygenase